MTFLERLQQIHAMPYGRISDSKNPNLVATENRGTCSSKHAYAGILAQANDIADFQLYFGVFLLDAEQFPELKPILGEIKIPEVHCFVRWEGKHWDLSYPSKDPQSPQHEYYKTVPVSVDTVLNDKKAFHEAEIREYNNPESEEVLKHLWSLREKCIARWSR